MLPEYVIGVDLGQSRDYTAVCVAECGGEPTGEVEAIPNLAAYWDDTGTAPAWVPVRRVAGTYRLTHLERLPLGTPYTAIPATVRRIEGALRAYWMEHHVRPWERSIMEAGGRLGGYPTLADCPIELAVDKTGVGAAVVDHLRAAGLDPLSVTITGGDQVTEAGWRELRVPKRDLVSVVNVLLQTRRLRIAANLAHAPTLRAELENFKAKISLGGHDSYGAGDDWREGNHDDLVLATALACWCGERRLAERTGGPLIAA